MWVNLNKGFVVGKFSQEKWIEFEKRYFWLQKEKEIDRKSYEGVLESGKIKIIYDMQIWFFIYLFIDVIY